MYLSGNSWCRVFIIFSLEMSNFLSSCFTNLRGFSKNGDREFSDMTGLLKNVLHFVKVVCHFRHEAYNFVKLSRT